MTERPPPGTTTIKTASPRRRGRPSADLSAKITTDIISQATKMFLEFGFEETSIDALSKEINVPKTTIYKRFSDKADLLNAVVETEIARWSSIRSQELTDLGSDLRSRLIHYVTTLLTWTTKPEVQAINKLAAHLPNLPNGKFKGRNLSGYQNMKMRLCEAIEEFGPAWGVSAQAPNEAADMIMALVAGVVALRTEASPIEPLEAREMAEGLVARLLRGAPSW